MSQVSKSLASHISASINRTGKMDPVTRRFNPCLAFCVVNILLLCIGNLTYDPQSYIILREAFFQGQEHRRHCALNLLSISNAYAARVPPNSGDTARPLTSSNAGRRSSSPTPPASTASNRHPPLHQPSTAPTTAATGTSTVPRRISGRQEQTASSSRGPGLVTGVPGRHHPYRRPPAAVSLPMGVTQASSSPSSASAARAATTVHQRDRSAGIQTGPNEGALRAQISRRLQEHRRRLLQQISLHQYLLQHYRDPHNPSYVVVTPDILHTL
ncbi:putative transmembrane protein [Toxoplasma gondii TgCatPRC2]|uniref:Transmembrane protein n=11 Tax=Toxoplasma gondii TaxID=5811 RepID=A0A125YGY1_TOXGG|nr:hypothetical protein TGME49_294980 [Toxoplasma gondii ME49]EPR57736.1 hypothetical protein TGGT1_294980 [Toxoplasma gondii GT1]ESS29173.1 putative transmembrane protein [Toxoplasma gondii VEG]KAF4646215.1 hypothetical protein TGRH88_020020 [Toxoplasma gondii]KFG35251.1 putative transmembrane protein [Toxoplasma gondii p89]KFG37288.1 putative transmembrane protein [Toxoplasma gondii GAB2-2007-GAL-DOM2]KFG46584.1 putative transmembrane protein [Toxoplasma gondii FOU]KFH14232.1 putative tran|eukprot:XP_002370267.1 hypothetical protein TGME49_294980 [Toxoplasma gondii ME49]